MERYSVSLGAGPTAVWAFSCPAGFLAVGPPGSVISHTLRTCGKVRTHEW